MIKLIPHTKKGHGLIVFCNCCNKSQTIDNHCNHKNRWKYKADFKWKSKRYTRILESNDLDKALNELLNFKEYIKKPKIISQSLLSQSPTILNAIDKYLAKVTCQEEFKHNKRKSKDHQTECIRVINRFGASLKSAGIDLATTPIDNLTVSVLSVFYNYLEDNYNIGSDSGKDKHTRIMRAFFRFLEKVGMYNGANFFKAIETSTITSNPISVTDEEFNRLLDVISEENGNIIRQGVKRKLYAGWLKSAIFIGRHTGLRREEIYNLKWSDIIEYDGEKFFNVIDGKVSKQKGELYLKAAPITNELYQYLLLLKGNSSSEKIIDSGLTQNSFKDFLSRSFTHFFKIAYPTTNVKHFKHLRKTHITELQAMLGEDAYLGSGHSGNRVLEKHYIDRIAAVTKFSKFKNRIANKS